MFYLKCCFTVIIYFLQLFTAGTVGPVGTHAFEMQLQRQPFRSSDNSNRILSWLRRYTYFNYSVTVGTPFTNVVAINSVLPLHHRCSCTSSNSWPPLRRHCSRLQSQVQTAHHPAPLQPITCVFQYTGAQQQWLRHYQNPLRNPSVHFGSHWHYVEQAQHSSVCICFRSCVQRLRATHAMQHEV